MAKTQTVQEFMETMDHPFKDVIDAVRQIILSANPKIAERVKWNAPSFYHSDTQDDLAAFNLHIKDKAMLVLVFPHGLVEDDSGFLQGDYKDRRLAYFHSMEDVTKHRKKLEKVVNNWVKLVN